MTARRVLVDIGRARVECEECIAGRLLRRRVADVCPYLAPLDALGLREPRGGLFVDEVDHERRGPGRLEAPEGPRTGRADPRPRLLARREADRDAHRVVDADGHSVMVATGGVAVR